MTLQMTGTLAQALENTDSWAPVVLLLVIAIGFAVVNIGASLVLGPARTGPGKEETYESGMVPIGDTRKRFNVRFYVIAMIFLVFDVEIVFLYPWAAIFSPAAGNKTLDGRGFGAMLLFEMAIFVAILLLAYFYAWGKGVFRWD
jgi:NADH-quinone oxidoreductase subunit A